MVVNKRAKRDAGQLYRLCLVNGLLDEDRAREVVRVAAAAGNRNALAVLAHFLRLVKLDRARHSASVESATPLPPELRATVEAGLTRRYGPGLSTAFAHLPSLIGGMRVRVGSDVYDGSVLAGLTALERSF